MDYLKKVAGFLHKMSELKENIFSFIVDVIEENGGKITFNKPESISKDFNDVNEVWVSDSEIEGNRKNINFNTFGDNSVYEDGDISSVDEAYRLLSVIVQEINLQKKDKVDKSEFKSNNKILRYVRTDYGVENVCSTVIPSYMTVKDGVLFNENTKKREAVGGDIVSWYDPETGNRIDCKVHAYTDYQIIHEDLGSQEPYYKTIVLTAEMASKKFVSKRNTKIIGIVPLSYEQLDNLPF